MAVAVILAAGKGTRLWPVTNGTPKALVRVAGKPLAEWCAEGVAPNFAKIVLVVSKADAPAFEKHFAGKPYSKKLEFAVQETQQGTAHAVLAAQKQVGKSDFLVLNGDCFFSSDFYATLGEKLKGKKPLVFAKKVADASPFGLLKIRGKMLAGIAEKTPGSTGLVNTGAYYASNELMAFFSKVTLSPRGELEATNGLQAYAAKHATEVVEHKGFWTDVGYYWNYLEANRHALENGMQNKIEGTVEPGVTVKGKLFVGKGSTVKAGTYIEGPTYIGENCTVGPGAYLRPGTFLEGNNHVGKSEVKNSILLKGANAPHFNYVGDSVLCEDVNLGAGAKTANFRFDAGEISIELKGQIVDSGRNKLGSCIGRETKVGVNATINCGVLVGAGCRVLPNTFLSRNLADGGTSKGD